MGCDVYANNNEIACKAGGGKVIATFPDVCLSPPSPPAGPIPVPYPDTSFSKDMKQGSKTVKIKGKEVMLKDKSYYNTSPLGDEPATKGLGAGVISHVITGKTYFVAWSMDVKIEGENVDRHIDMTTSNAASLAPTAAIPWANMSLMEIADWEDREGICACCNRPKHANQTGPAVSEDTYYNLNEQIVDPPVPHPQNRRAVRAYEPQMAENRARRAALTERNKAVRGARREGCLAEKPCNIYRIAAPAGSQAARAEADEYMPQWRDEKGTPLVRGGVQATVNHLTPLTGGGCPVGGNNLKADRTTKDPSAQMKPHCQAYDGQLTVIQGQLANERFPQQE
jgi:hypothetical protein